ncbi:hypothetical protein ACT453_45465, partial [Bacillus sp. D-CC]
QTTFATYRMKLYQRFFEYIDLPTKVDKKSSLFYYVLVNAKLQFGRKSMSIPFFFVSILTLFALISNYLRYV